MTPRDEFEVNVPVLAGLVVLVSLAFGFGAITKYGGLPRSAAPATQPVSARASALLTAVRLHPSAEGYLNLSMVYYQEKHFQEAVNAAQESVRLKPELPEAWNNLGAAFAELERWDEALRAEQNALRLKPDFQLARNNLLWAQSGKARASGK